jgi:colanic acid/amylovoran biosynthesis glycosyltransferase
MIKVAHVMSHYLGQPETFIWQYLHKFKNIFPVVIAKSTQNLDQFPLVRGKIYSISGSRLSVPWFIDNWYRRLINEPLGYAERIIRKESVNIIHAHYGPIGCEYLPLLSSLKISLITNFYGYDLSVNRVVDKNENEYLELFKKGTHFLVEGPCMRETLLSLGCPEEKISLQRIALDLNKYDFNSSLRDQINPARFLFVGRFVEKKGLEYALRALAKLRNDFVFEFRIVGGGDLEKKMHQLSVELGFTKEIKWLGVQSHSRVIQELYDCDILIQPSVTAINGDTEGGAPTIILEAQACGVPVISTTHADIPYITSPEKSALLSPEKDVENLCYNTRYLLNNSEVWSKMGKQGRRHVEKYHDVEKEVLTLEKIYENCLG